MRKLLTILLMMWGAGSMPAAGQGNVRMGAYSSFKGFGLSGVYSVSSSGNELEQIDLYADTYGLTSGRTSDVGVFMNYLHNYIFRSVDNEWYDLFLFAGAGLGTGFVHDHEKGLFSDVPVPLGKPRRFVFSLACGAGVMADFKTLPMSMSLTFCVNPGITISRNPENASTVVSLYRNGLYRALYPQLSILYHF